MSDFTHVKNAQPAMVDISGKSATSRTAKAEARVWLPQEVRDRFDGSDLRSAKGAVFHTAVIAGIQAAKRTDELIPLCHSLPLDECRITIALNGEYAHIECAVKTDHRTGVEMEALCGASVAALTLYDMCKALSQEMVIESIRLLEKTGGKNDYQRSC